MSKQELNLNKPISEYGIELPYYLEKLKLDLQRWLSFLMPEITKPQIEEEIKGSSKLIEVYDDGSAVLTNTDEFSVFDIGSDVLKAEIRHKGEAEAMLTMMLFESLHEAGVKTHLNGAVDAEGNLIKRFNQTTQPFNKLKVQWLARPELSSQNGGYDYSQFVDAIKAGQPVILPFELIYRDQIIGGVSSCAKDDESFRNFLHQNPNLSFESDKRPKQGEMLHIPRGVVNVTTKYEKTDKPLSIDEATALLNQLVDMRKVQEFVATAAKIIIEEFREIGVIVPDLKLEIGLNEQGELMVVDVIGPDELRLLWEVGSGESSLFHDFSKQEMRRLLKQSNFCRLCLEAQSKYGDHWKNEFLLSEAYKPYNQAPTINPSILDAQSMLYRALVNSLAGNNYGRSIYQGVGNLEQEVGIYLATVQALEISGKVFTNDPSLQAQETKEVVYF